MRSKKRPAPYYPLSGKNTAEAKEKNQKKSRRIGGIGSFRVKAQAMRSNFSAGAPHTGHLSGALRAWVYPQNGQT